jgi:hypothetical protein
VLVAAGLFLGIKITISIVNAMTLMGKIVNAKRKDKDGTTYATRGRYVVFKTQTIRARFSIAESDLGLKKWDAG